MGHPLRAVLVAGTREHFFLNKFTRFIRVRGSEIMKNRIFINLVLNIHIRMMKISMNQPNGYTISANKELY